MCQLIGQTKLLTAINRYSINTLPKTMLFVGELGCGKKTFAKYLADRLELDFVEIDKTVDSESLQDYTHNTISTIYLINLDSFSDKQQNQFLKFIEEPSKSVYIILTTSSEANVLPTVLNRCIRYCFEPYTQEELQKISGSIYTNPLAISIFKTPGKLSNLTDAGFNDLMSLANTVVQKVNVAQYANTLLITNKINYKDLYNKIDFNLFFDAVEYLAFEDFKNNNNQNSFTIYKITNRFKQLATRQNLLKETLMLNYLTTLWEAVHNDFSRA